MEELAARVAEWIIKGIYILIGLFVFLMVLFGAYTVVEAFL